MTDSHLRAYVDFLEGKTDLRLPMKVVCDFSNGPASIVVRELASRLSSSVSFIMMNSEVLPDFPAHGPDPSSAKAITEVGMKVIEEKADLGVIFDGDGDRAVFIDEHGVPISQSAIALFLMTKTPGTHVVDILLYEAMTHYDPSLAERIRPSKVGRYFISRAMKEHGAALGAELSGHFFFKEFFGLDSAVLNMIFVLNLLSRAKEPASVIFSKYAGHTVIAGKAELSGSFSDAVERARLSVAARNPRIGDTDGLTIDFGDRWVNLRASNTEPIVRVTAGASDPIIAQTLMEDVKKILA
jgi:phosphomannomutase